MAGSVVQPAWHFSIDVVSPLTATVTAMEASSSQALLDIERSFVHSANSAYLGNGRRPSPGGSSVPAVIADRPFLSIGLATDLLFLHTSGCICLLLERSAVRGLDFIK